MTSIIDDITPYLQQNTRYFLEDTPTKKTLKPLSLSDRLCFFLEPDLEKEQMRKITALMTAALKETARPENIAEALNSKTLTACKLFYKQVKLEHGQHLKEAHLQEVVAALEKEIAAYKFSLSSDLFDAPQNEGFLKFATLPPLERYLFEYRHNLDVQNGHIMIRMNDVMVKWQEAKQTISKAPTTTPCQRWLYGPYGVQNENMYTWETLKPYKFGDASTWNYNYIFEFCVCCTATPNKTGDHTWVRLKTPQGEIYSVGLYRPSKRGWKDNYQMPLRIKKGYLMQPDVSEFWPMDIYKLPIAITKAQFEAMKQTIEEDKKEDRQTFQLFHGNCTLYAAKIARIAGILLPTAKDTWRIIAPKPLEKAVDYTASYLPEAVSKIARFAVGVFFNVLQLLLGASVVDAEVQLTHDKAKPHISGFDDLINPLKSEMNHPNTLAKETRDQIFSWRENQKKEYEMRLQNAQGQEAELIKAKLATIDFDIPQEYRINPSH